MHCPRLSNRWPRFALGRPIRGATLIELVIAIVIFAAASAGVLAIYTDATKSSVDPQIRAQGRAIAEAYMDEILLQRYCEDPDQADCGTEVGGGGAEETDREDFNDVFDYDTITNQSPPQDQLGNDLDDGAFAQIADYTVDVSVAGDPATADPADITVTVTHSTGKIDYALFSIREKY